MNEKIITRCGYRCDLCLAYAPNIEESPQNPYTLSEGWYHYFGLQIKPGEIYCEGCLAEDDNAVLIDKDCPVRPCVKDKGLDNCSGCKQYICNKLQERVVSRGQIEKKIGINIPEEDYRRFIKPYENLKHLKRYREK